MQRRAEVELDQADPLSAVDAALLALTAEVTVVRASTARPTPPWLPQRKTFGSRGASPLIRCASAVPWHGEPSWKPLTVQVQSWRTALEAHRRYDPLVSGDRRVAHSSQRGLLTHKSDLRASAASVKTWVKPHCRSRTPDALVGGELSGLGAALQTEAALPPGTGGRSQSSDRAAAAGPRWNSV